MAARRASGNGPLKRVPTYRRESRCFVCISCRALGSNAKVPLKAFPVDGAYPEKSDKSLRSDSAELNHRSTKVCFSLSTDQDFNLRKKLWPRRMVPDRAPSHVGGSSPHWPAFTPLRWPGFSPPLTSCSFQGTHGIRARGAGRISWTSYARDRGSNCKSKRIQNQRFLCLIGAFADELWLAKQARRLWQLGQPGSTWVVESEQKRPVLSGQRTAAGWASTEEKNGAQLNSYGSQKGTLHWPDRCM